MWNCWKIFGCNFLWNEIFRIFACIILLLLLYVKFAKLQRIRNSRSEVFLHKHFSRFLLKILYYFSLCFPNSVIAVFRKHVSVAIFKVINIHSLFSFIFMLLEVFTNRNLEQFLFIILSLHSVISFYAYVYDG